MPLIDEEYYNIGLLDDNCANLHVNCKSLNYLVVSLRKINPILSCFTSKLDKDSDNDINSMDEEEMRAYFMKIVSKALNIPLLYNSS